MRVTRAVAPSAPNAGPRGFTLLEVLVALTLMGLVATLLAGSLRFGSRVWEVGRIRAEASTDVLAARGALRRTLGELILYPPDEEDENEHVTLHGERDRVRFLAPRVTASLLGAVYAYDVHVRQGENGSDLVLEYMRYAPDARGSTRPEEKEVTLIADIASVEFEFFGVVRDGQGAAWHDRWEDEEAVPRMIRVSIGFDRKDVRSWPALLIPTHVIPVTESAS